MLSILSVNAVRGYLFTIQIHLEGQSAPIVSLHSVTIFLFAGKMQVQYLVKLSLTFP